MHSPPSYKNPLAQRASRRRGWRLRIRPAHGPHIPREPHTRAPPARPMPPAPLRDSSRPAHTSGRQRACCPRRNAGRAALSPHPPRGGDAHTAGAGRDGPRALVPGSLPGRRTPPRRWPGRSRGRQAATATGAAATGAAAAAAAARPSRRGQDAGGGRAATLTWRRPRPTAESPPPGRAPVTRHPSGPRQPPCPQRRPVPVRGARRGGGRERGEGPGPRCSPRALGAGLHRTQVPAPSRPDDRCRGRGGRGPAGPERDAGVGVARQDPARPVAQRSARLAATRPGSPSGPRRLGFLGGTRRGPGCKPLPAGTRLSAQVLGVSSEYPRAPGRHLLPTLHGTHFLLLFSLRHSGLGPGSRPGRAHPRPVPVPPRLPSAALFRGHCGSNPGPLHGTPSPELFLLRRGLSKLPRLDWNM